MPQTGILKKNGDLNVYVAHCYDQDCKLAETFVFTGQYTRLEIQTEAVKLWDTATKGRMLKIDIMEHEVLAKEPVPRLADHGQFVEEIHAAVAAFRISVTRRFGHDNGDHWGIFNGPVSIAQNDLIERSRYIP